MPEEWLKLAEAWHDFYLLAGSAGAALVGLMFVVVSLGPHVVTQRGARGFCTPIIVDFTAAFVISGLMMAPGLTSLSLGLILAIAGLAGLVYQARTGAHGEWRKNQLPAVDWVWFVGLPYLAYAMLLAAAILIWREKIFGLYGVSSAALLLVIIGIRNAWDLVLWFAEQPRPD